MKILWFRLLRSISAGVILSGSVLLCRGQPFPSYIIDQFDTDTTANYISQGWGVFDVTLAFNPTNATPEAGLPDNPGSGSMQWRSSWGVIGDQILVIRGFTNIVNLNHYTSIRFDIQFLPDSATNAQGNYSTLEIDAVPLVDGWCSTVIGFFVASATNGNNWIHARVPIPTGVPKLDAVSGLGFKIQQLASGQAVSNVTDFLIDNVVLEGNQTLLPPPTMSISKFISPPGMVIVCEGGGNQYVRSLLMSQDPINGFNFSWVGATQPVTYSRTIAHFPDTNHLGFQSVFYMVPNGAADRNIDYDALSSIQVGVTLNSDGSALGVFRYKTNWPFSNWPVLPNDPTTVLVPAGAVGTWSVTFVNDTNITFNGPGGVSTNFSITADVAAVFANPLSIYYGIQQGGNAANVGEFVTYSQLSATGLPVSTSFTDNFNANAIDTSIWQVLDDTAPFNFFVLPSGDSYLTSWTQPNAGFSPFISPALGAPASWSLVTSNRVHTAAWNGTVLFPSAVPTNSNWYVRLAK